MLTKSKAKRIDWLLARPPFDKLKGCQKCLSMHAIDGCGYSDHEDVTRDAKKAGLQNGNRGVTTEWVKEKFSKFLELRKKHAKHYKIELQEPK